MFYTALSVVNEAISQLISVFQADLLAEGSFDDIVKGADFVFHTASPFIRLVSSHFNCFAEAERRPRAL